MGWSSRGRLATARGAAWHRHNDSDTKPHFRGAGALGAPHSYGTIVRRGSCIQLPARGRPWDAIAGRRPCAPGPPRRASTCATPSCCSSRSRSCWRRRARAFARRGGWMPRIETTRDAGAGARPAGRGARRASSALDPVARPLRAARCCVAGRGAPAGAARSARVRAGAVAAWSRPRRRWRARRPRPAAGAAPALLGAARANCCCRSAGPGASERCWRASRSNGRPPRPRRRPIACSCLRAERLDRGAGRRRRRLVDRAARAQPRRAVRLLLGRRPGRARGPGCRARRRPTPRPRSPSATASRTRRRRRGAGAGACRARRDAGRADRAGPRTGAPHPRAARAPAGACCSTRPAGGCRPPAPRRRSMACSTPPRHDAATDALLDWLKAVHDLAPPVATRARGRLPTPADRARRRPGRRGRLDAAGRRALWRWPTASLAPLRAAPRSRRCRLAAPRSRTALRASGSLEPLRADAAGRQVLDALRCARRRRAPRRWTPAHAGGDGPGGVRAPGSTTCSSRRTSCPRRRATRRPRSSSRRWRGRCCGPSRPSCCPGADDSAPRRARRRRAALLGDAQAAALGLPDAGGAPARPNCSPSRSCCALPRSPSCAGASTAASRWPPARWSNASAWRWPRHGRDARRVGRSARRRAVPPAPIRTPRRAAPRLLPRASRPARCEALRACPYRFFALRCCACARTTSSTARSRSATTATGCMRCCTTSTRARRRPAAADGRGRAADGAGARAAGQRGLDEADFLPYRARRSTTFAPRYVRLAARAATRDGARWRAGEHEHDAWRCPALDGIVLHGIIDRIDERLAMAAPVVELIDYKTGSAAALKEQGRASRSRTRSSRSMPR